MESFVNQPFLAKRAKWARWGSYVGLGALFIGLFLTTRYLLISYILLLIGLIGATMGSYLSSRYVREPRADQVLAKALENLDKRYALYSYYLSSHYVIASHYGLTVVIPRAQAGEVTFANGRWSHKAGWQKLLQFFGEPGLGKPDQEATEEAKWVKEWIDKAMPEANIPVNSVIVFTNPKVTLRLESPPPVPAVLAEELSEYMRQGLKGQPTLSTTQQKELRRLLDEVVAQASPA